MPVIGGGAAPRSNRHPTRESWQFFGDQAVRDAVPVLLFSGPLMYSFGTDAGWRPIGPKGRVTEVAGGVVHQIDGKPALSFYERYLGEGFQPAFATPLAVFDGEGSGSYLRAPVHHDPDTGADAPSPAMCRRAPEGLADDRRDRRDLRRGSLPR